jgi:hypothetical protein
MNLYFKEFIIDKFNNLMNENFNIIMNRFNIKNSFKK